MPTAANRLFPTSISRRRFLAATSGLCTLGATASQSRAAAPTPPPPGLRLLTCGHSFHVWMPAILADLAEKGRIQGHQTVGISAIGGSRVVQHWDLPDDKNVAKQTLLAGKADVLTLAPIWLPDEGMEKFARLGVEHNPNLRVFVQEFWLPNDEYNPIYPLDTRKKVDHNATDLGELRKANQRYEHDIETHVREINQRLGKETVGVVPVGAASIALREQIAAGKVRVLKVQWRLFRDDWGHPTPPLKILAAYCFYAAIYRRSPVGLPMPEEFLSNRDYAVSTLNTLLQEIAWQTVCDHPLTGVTG